MDKLTLTVREAAVLLGISRGLAYEMVRIGKIPSVRMGKRVLIPQRALQRLLDTQTKGRYSAATDIGERECSISAGPERSGSER